MGKSRDSADDPVVYRTALTTTNHMPPNVSCAEVEKLWSKVYFVYIYTLRHWPGKPVLTVTLLCSKYVSEFQNGLINGPLMQSQFVNWGLCNC